MGVKSIVYKLNSENFKEFKIDNSNNSETLFIIRDFDNIEVKEILRLLKNNRKILISDHSIIDCEKILLIKKSLIENPQLFKNLFISKEVYLKTWFHNDYYDILKELEITNLLSVDDIIKSEAFTRIVIKLKFFDCPSYLLKCLDSSLFLKKLSLESFKVFKFDLVEEFNKLVNFYKEVEDNLVASTSIFIEQNSKEYDIVCNVVDNLVYEDLINIESSKIGIASALDITENTVAQMTPFEKHQVNFPAESSVGWIDVVDLKYKIKKMNIDTLYVNGLELYNNLEEIKVCSEYGFNGNRTKSPQDIDECDSIVPLYSKFDGWQKEILDIQEPSDVPCELLYLISEIKKLTSVNEIVVLLNYLEIRL